MAYETKVLLIALADAACEKRAESMYILIAKMANAEGVVLKPYKEARAELDAENAELTSKCD